jgi:hypothetical protein
VRVGIDRWRGRAACGTLLKRAVEGLKVNIEQNKAIAARLTRELYNDGRDVDVVYELLAEDFFDHTPGEGSSGDRESLRLRALALREPFSEIQATTDAQMTVVSSWR